MKEPHIARRKPCLVEVQEGKRYLWCACGKSAKQPFCDGSHRDTGFTPVVWTADRTGEVLLCACKHTRTQPICDGSHNQLSETYAEAGENDGAAAVLVDYERRPDGALKAALDNGCYVLRVDESSMTQRGSLRIYPVINPAEGADKLSQYSAVAAPGVSPVLRFPGSDVVLFIREGSGSVDIGGRRFPVGPETGVCVKPGEAFRIHNEAPEGAVDFSISVCPPCDEPEFLEEMPADFDESVPDRIQGVDTSKQEAMGDRFFQVLISDKSHRTPVTLFIGEIPQSRAAHHRHIYEETITVLSGEGFMWTDETKTPVRSGDVIYLPLKQAHSLECTSPGGMRLLGAFYPSMSPAINY